MGSFDMLHPGHLGLFNWCRNIAGPSGRVWVAVNSDDFVTRFKTAPRYNEDERMALVRGLQAVDGVILNNGKDQRTLIKSVTPHILLIGSDWARKDYLKQIDVTQDWLDEQNIALIYVPRTGDWSSTELRAR